MGMLKNEGRAKSAWLSLGLGPQRCQARFCEFIFQHSHLHVSSWESALASLFLQFLHFRVERLESDGVQY